MLDWLKRLVSEANWREISAFLAVLATLSTVLTWCWIRLIRPAGKWGKIKSAKFSGRVGTLARHVVAIGRGRYALVTRRPLYMLWVASRIDALERDNRSPECSYYLAMALAYFGQRDEAIAVDLAGAACGMWYAGCLRDAVSLLEAQKGTNSAAYVHWDFLRKQLGPEHKTDAVAPNCGLVIAIGGAVRADNPGVTWPPEFADLNGYFAQAPKGFYAFRDASVIKTVDAARLRVLSKLCASLHSEDGMVKALSSLAILTKKVAA